ncbi:nuclear transport factor 2 family protein [Amnibacterium setariae]|nr:nuclear transport factor 2 family protein [Amnibacterium setariae]
MADQHALPRPDPDADEVVVRVYRAYSAQRLDELLGLVTTDVDWPDGNARLHGRAALRAYWTEQWSRTRTEDVPIGVARVDDRTSAVLIDQVVRGLAGEVRSRARVLHVLRFDDGRIARLDIVPLAPRPARPAPNPSSDSEEAR